MLVVWSPIAAPLRVGKAEGFLQEGHAQTAMAIWMELTKLFVPKKVDYLRCCEYEDAVAVFMHKWTRLIEPEGVYDDYEKAAKHFKTLDAWGVDFVSLDEVRPATRLASPASATNSLHTCSSNLLLHHTKGKCRLYLHSDVQLFLAVHVIPNRVTQSLKARAPPLLTPPHSPRSRFQPPNLKGETRTFIHLDLSVCFQRST